jgi:histidinol-phosphatase (PHP family)
VLSDLHLHLRPDDLDASAGEYYSAANAERYREAAGERGIAELGVSEHVYRFRQALDVWRHPFWESYAHDDLDQYCVFVREQTDLRLGLEVDYVPGRERQIAELIEARALDYVVGSVHFVGEVAVDMNDYSVWDPRQGAGAEEVWERYFGAVAASARSGLFDIIAHPDLVKYWGPAAGRTPTGDLRRFYEPAVQAISEAGVAVELSTAGLRKPVAELYPAPAMLAMCVEAGIPVALSSDAHRPADVGSGYERALALLEQLGVSELCAFEQRRRTLRPIGAEHPSGAAPV